MIGAPIAHIVVVLIVANALASVAVWRSARVDLSPVIQTSPPAAPATSSDAVQPSFKRSVRLGDPAAARLFGTPTGTPKATEAVEPDVRSLETAMRLVGVMFMNETDKEPIALIEHGTPAKVTRLRAGVLLNPSGWRVERVMPSAVELVRGDYHVVLKLDQDP
ncbi:type II secretion system protein N [Methylorubrum extorquens]|uniref:type II secretion system protein N n=1 Tax=Methylorubrum extorquens TaxID=408 RepID=UPI0013019B88|nr:type II secretion system protein N [Methylorubrum extorquens]MCP1545766.1 hypothetical protein [Methylorubrum extorquens]MCP1591717.1 hypothetical protein [Methylorubrum extorquens]